MLITSLVSMCRVQNVREKTECFPLWIQQRAQEVLTCAKLITVKVTETYKRIKAVLCCPCQLWKFTLFRSNLCISPSLLQLMLRSHKQTAVFEANANITIPTASMTRHKRELSSNDVQPHTFRWFFLLFAVTKQSWEWWESQICSY